MKYGCHEFYLMNNIYLKMWIKSIRNTNSCWHYYDGTINITILPLVLDRWCRKNPTKKTQDE